MLDLTELSNAARNLRAQTASVDIAFSADYYRFAILVIQRVKAKPSLVSILASRVIYVYRYVQSLNGW